MAPPRTPTEATLAALWAELLGHKRVGVDDDFLDLGGHSLAAMRLVGRVRQSFGVDLSPQRLFEGATVASLARRVDEAAARAADDSAASLRERIGQMDAAEVRERLLQQRARLATHTTAHTTAHTTSHPTSHPTPHTTTPRSPR